MWIAGRARNRYVHLHGGIQSDFLTGLDEYSLESEIQGVSGKRMVGCPNEHLRVELHSGKTPLFHDGVLHPTVWVHKAGKDLNGRIFNRSSWNPAIVH